MAFRFQRRIKILPGVTVNVSKSGLSTSLGPKGAKVTLGHGKVRKTVGLPGTGLSFTEVSSRKEKQAQEPKAAPTGVRSWGFFKLLGAGMCVLCVLIIVNGIIGK